MPTYLVTDPDTGQQLRLTGDSPPTEQELEQIFSSQPARTVSRGNDQSQAAIADLKQQITQAESELEAALSGPRVSGRSGTASRVSGARSKISDLKKQLQTEEFLASLSEGQRANLEAIGPLDAAAIGAGRGLTKIGRAVGLADQESDFERQAFEQLKEVRPVSTTGGEIVGESAPFLVPGLGQPALAARLGGGLAARATTTAGLGALEGTLIAKGEGRDLGQILFSAGIGGSVAGAIQLAGPLLSRLGGSLVRSQLGKRPSGNIIDANGQPSDEFIEALDSAGLNFDDVAEQITVDLAEETLDPSQTARAAFFRQQGLEPTRAQITRKADDFQAQQEAFKGSGRVREALEAQEATLTSRFDNAVLETGGEAFTPTSGVTDVLTQKATVLDKQISDLYKAARESASDNKNIRFSRLTRKLKELAPSNRRSGGNIEAVIGDMQAKGILDKNLNVVGKVDVQTAEDLRQLTNELFDPQNGFGNAILRQIKDSLDDDVFSAAGKDTFKKARKAKADFEKGLTRAKISKFDSRKKNIVRDILENKDSVNPEQFVDKVVFGKSWRGSDLKQLKDYLLDGTGDAGQKAFNDLRAETMQKIKEMSFIGSVDEVGNRALSRDKLAKALKSIGRDKINTLFTRQEQRFLRDMTKLSELREPVRGTALGLGPTGAAINKLRAELRKGSIIADLVDTVSFDRQGRAVLKANPDRLRQPPQPPGRIPVLPQVGAAAGVVAASEEDRRQ